MSPTEDQLYVRFVVGDLTIDGVTVGLDCSFKSTKEVLYGTMAATVIFVIVIQEVNQLFYFVYYHPDVFFEVFPKFRSVSFELDAYSAPGFIDVKNRSGFYQLVSEV